MTNSGDAAEQVVRLSLEGFEVAPDSYIIYRRYSYDFRFMFGHIKLFIFFLKIKSHGSVSFL